MNEDKLNEYVAAQEVEIPQSLIESEISAILIEMQCRRRYEGLAGSGPLTYSPQELEEQMGDIQAEAIQAVKTRLIIQKIIAEQHIEVSYEELEAEAREIAKRKQISFDMVKGFLGENFGLLKSDLKERKAIEYICNQI